MSIGKPVGDAARSIARGLREKLSAAEKALLIAELNSDDGDERLITRAELNEAIAAISIPGTIEIGTAFALPSAIAAGATWSQVVSGIVGASSATSGVLVTATPTLTQDGDPFLAGETVSPEAAIAGSVTLTAVGCAPVTVPLPEVIALQAAPTLITFDRVTVPEDAAAGFVVGTPTADVPDAVISLIGSAGGTFDLVGGEVVVANPALIDFETASSLDIALRAATNGGQIDAGFAVGIGDVAGPSATGALPDRTYSQGSGVQTVNAAADFVGITAGTTWSVTGVGASVDASGVVSITTDTIRASSAVAVTATNDEGSASSGFSVVVTATVLASLELTSFHIQHFDAAYPGSNTVGWHLRSAPTDDWEDQIDHYEVSRDGGSTWATAPYGPAAGSRLSEGPIGPATNLLIRAVTGTGRTGPAYALPAEAPATFIAPDQQRTVTDKAGLLAAAAEATASPGASFRVALRGPGNGGDFSDLIGDDWKNLLENRTADFTICPADILDPPTLSKIKLYKTIYDPGAGATLGHLTVQHLRVYDEHPVVQHYLQDLQPNQKFIVELVGSNAALRAIRLDGVLFQSNAPHARTGLSPQHRVTGLQITDSDAGSAIDVVRASFDHVFGGLELKRATNVTLDRATFRWLWDDPWKIITSQVDAETAGTCADCAILDPIVYDCIGDHGWHFDVGGHIFASPKFNASITGLHVRGLIGFPGREGIRQPVKGNAQSFDLNANKDYTYQPTLSGDLSILTQADIDSRNLKAFILDNSAGPIEVILGDPSGWAATPPTWDPTPSAGKTPAYDLLVQVVSANYPVTFRREDGTALIIEEEGLEAVSYSTRQQGHTFTLITSGQGAPGADWIVRERGPAYQHHWADDAQDTADVRYEFELALYSSKAGYWYDNWTSVARCCTWLTFAPGTVWGTRPNRRANGWPSGGFDDTSGYTSLTEDQQFFGMVMTGLVDRADGVTRVEAQFPRNTYATASRSDFLWLARNYDLGPDFDLLDPSTFRFFSVSPEDHLRLLRPLAGGEVETARHGPLRADADEDYYNFGQHAAEPFGPREARLRTVTSPAIVPAPDGALVTWDLPLTEEAITDYEWELSTDGGTSWTAGAPWGGGALEVTVSGLTGGVDTVRARIRPVTAVATGRWVETAEVLAGEAVAAPAFLAEFKKVQADSTGGAGYVFPLGDLVVPNADEDLLFIAHVRCGGTAPAADLSLTVGGVEAEEVRFAEGGFRANVSIFRIKGGLAAGSHAVELTNAATTGNPATGVHLSAFEAPHGSITATAASGKAATSISLPIAPAVVGSYVIWGFTLNSTAAIASITGTGAVLAGYTAAGEVTHAMSVLATGAASTSTDPMSSGVTMAANTQLAAVAVELRP